MTTARIRISANVENSMERSLVEQPARFRSMLLRFLLRAGQLVVADMRETTAPQLKHYPQVGAPRPGGALVASMRASAPTLTRTGEGGLISIGPHVPYDIIVDQGARPHIIRPKTAGGRLRFVAGGRIVFARAVHHPGFAGYHFTDETATTSAPKVEGLAARIFLGSGGVSLA